MTLSVYRWEDVHRYFPQEVIEQYRKKIMEEWKSGKFKDREIRERYGMSENAFYAFIQVLSVHLRPGMARIPPVLTVRSI